MTEALSGRVMLPTSVCLQVHGPQAGNPKSSGVFSTDYSAACIQEKYQEKRAREWGSLVFE
eukprot:135668-Pelagomonas_calceolata.AAC.4